LVIMTAASRFGRVVASQARNRISPNRGSDSEEP
jgi:hypothetical protein